MSTEATNPEPERSSNATLDELIDLLLHRQDPFDQWLDAITTPVDNKYAIAQIGNIIRLSFAAGLQEKLSERIVTAVVKKDELGWPIERIHEFIDGIYPDLRKRQTNDERRRRGLPPLK